MKFSDLKQADWDGLRLYLDTCVLPVTGLSGAEQPWEATQELEYLRDVLECVEVPYKGRIVTYPAFHYYNEETGAAQVNSVCEQAKESGFRFVIVMTGHPRVSKDIFPAADLVLCPEMVEGEVMQDSDFRQHVSTVVSAMWQNGKKNG